MIKIDIDWSKAPEGATHVALTGGADGHHVWYKIFDGFYQYCYSDQLHKGWIRGEGSPSHAPRISRHVEWNGEGLPPVGTVCEIAASTPYLNIGHPEGTKVKVYANFTDDRGIELAAFVDEVGQVGGVCTAICLRPIRTPEQISAEEREAEIIEIERIATLGEDQGKTWASALYDAGYRKQVAP